MNLTISMDDMKEILGSLAQLDLEGLREASARIDYLLSGTTSNASRDDARMEAASLVWSQVCDVVRGTLGEEGPKFGLIVAGKLRPRLLNGAKIVLDYIDKNIRPRNRAHRIAVVRKLIEMSVRNITRRGYTELSYLSVLRSLARIPELVESEFPGYLRAGLLPAVFAMKGTVMLSKAKEYCGNGNSRPH